MYKWDEISLWIPNRFLKIETGENNSKGNETCLENLGKKSKEKVFALPVKTQYSSQDGMVLAEEKEKKNQNSWANARIQCWIRRHFKLMQKEWIT